MQDNQYNLTPESAEHYRSLSDASVLLTRVYKSAAAACFLSLIGMSIFAGFQWRDASLMRLAFIRQSKGINDCHWELRHSEAAQAVQRCAEGLK